ncbi:Glucosyltransferase-like protein [Tilletia horrida]|uniref:dolichyl-P-Glc:Man9GlcNAc2-PP-dolichol alpha-1,3-glucosyltransferase n=1 Tax=Tilletia horrida TaxID=155126 RepID=A0AAN6JPE1_9BASI|nr:Glucosyltransferase-like protein [Tilletia horrida]KAK0567521.1 Glucosyltransferase-like protein [Tilletia horrida]
MDLPEPTARKTSSRADRAGRSSSRSGSPVTIPAALPSPGEPGDPFTTQPISASGSGSGSGFRSARSTARRQRTNSTSSRAGERIFIPSNFDTHPIPSPVAGKHTGMPIQRFVSNASLASGYFREGSTSSALFATFEETAALAAASSQDNTPLRRYVRYMARERKGTRDLMIIGIIAAGWVRWAVGTSGWSGRGTPPKFGDFEAQRHWIELTLHLPYDQWYFYDLQYWGLDYPPLSGWLSMWCGKLASHFPSLDSSFALFDSRGAEAQPLPSFMRLTVLLCDAFVYFPAVLFFLSRRLRGSGRGTRTRSIAQLSVLFQPALILIDHGHFQYNNVMLGLSAGAFALLSTNLPNPDGPGFGLSSSGKRSSGPASGGADSSTPLSTRTSKRHLTNLSRRLSYDYVAAAILFSLSLGFKQMALYYAPAVFAIMLGRCWGLAAHVGFDRGLALFSGLAIFTTLTFVTTFHPWLTSPTQFLQVIHRIFPLARGIFEDKVANLWCFLSVLPIIPRSLRPKELMSVEALARVSMITTVLVILPGCIQLFWAGAQTVKVEMEVDEVQQRKGKVSQNGTDAHGRPYFAASIKAPSSYDGASVAGSVMATPLRQPRHRGSISTASATPMKSSVTGGVGASGHSTRSLLPPPPRQQASICPSPAARILPYALLSTSMAFFLFGFQVHEKSILLPLLPLTLLMCAKGDSWGGGEAKIDWEWAVLGNNVATFSLWPLLKKDGVGLQYTMMLFFWNWVIGHRPFSELLAGRQTFIGWFGGLVHVAMVGLHALEAGLPYLLSPSSLDRLTTRYPDLFPVLNVVLCTPVFGLIWLWALKRQLEVGFAVGLGGFGVLLNGGGSGGGAGSGSGASGRKGTPRASPAPVAATPIIRSTKVGAGGS